MAAEPSSSSDVGADFASLTARVAAAEGEARTSPDALRQALSELLTEWPLCFGYWKRLADHELAHSGEARAREVYEQAVGLCTHSVELWSLYAAHAAKHWGVPEKVRALFERAVGLVGTDYCAAPLWDRCTPPLPVTLSSPAFHLVPSSEHSPPAGTSPSRPPPPTATRPTTRASPPCTCACSRCPHS